MGELENLVAIWDRTDLLDRILEEGEAGVPETARPFVVAGLSRRARPLLMIVPRSRDAESFAVSMAQWLPGSQVGVFPAWEVLPGEAMSPTLDVMGRRIALAHRLVLGEGPVVVVAAVRAVLQRIGPPPTEQTVLAAGTDFRLDEIAQRLVEFGYERNYLVERPGEFSVRGGILDVFPPGRSQPVRADFFGDEITRLSEFSISSQRSHGDVASVALLPVRELLLGDSVRTRAAELLSRDDGSPERTADLARIAAGLSFPGMEAFLPVFEPNLRTLPELLPPEGRVVVCDPKQTRDRSVEFLAQAEQWASDESRELFAGFDETVGEDPIELWTYRRAEEGIDLDVSGWDEFLGRPESLANALRGHRAAGATIVVAGGLSAPRAQQVLADADFGLSISTPQIEGASVSRASIDRGFLLRLDGSPALAVAGQADLFGRRRPMAAVPADQAARPAALLLELAPGDFIVHELYGVGRYHGMVTREVAGVMRDYLLIEYAGDDRLYVPTDQLDAVTKYAGGDSPRLNRLGTAEWERAKSRARRAVADVAGELAILYAKRMQAPGHSFALDTPWQRELEDAFAFVETPDQARTIVEVKTDMERSIPMDRIVCGDVGYGKTEIAVRAAFKAVQDSKQVAVLVPTTILAQQHTQTFRERFAGFPIEVAMLSRFLTSSEQSEVLERLAVGKADVVIGTHRLLQPDVRFLDLGLLVIDEEQRFGVMHKEAIKKLRESVDVMTMSATPIPRTMEMALTGVRDMSLVDTPPANRRPVLTYVGPADERMITAAVRRELARDGQVFFVHNRVRSIRRAARKISGLVPGARVEIAHGQMSENELERVMVDVWDGKVDVLVCTTIIESGLDIPAMNTLIVERADLLGLAQLYQLRGRVGRAGERAYAYLLYPDETMLSEEAHERLKTLSEFTELGSGFKIALRDLEIRGAGNLLGAQQSGHIAAIGFDLYARMMAEAVSRLSGEAPEPKPEIRIDLPVDAFIPAPYIARESLRMDAYRQVEKVRSRQGAAELRAELQDRYGPIPEPLHNLLLVAELRAFLLEHGVTEIGARDGLLKVRPFPALSAAQEDWLQMMLPGASYKSVSETLLVPNAPSSLLVEWVLETLRAILAQTSAVT